MSDKAFLDTNIFVYAIAQDNPRTHDAEELITKGGTVSVQVLNEFAAVARRKINMSWGEVQLALESIRILCPDPLPIRLDTHQEALEIAEKYRYKICDALIVASALEAKCTILYTEDMQDRQIIDHRLTIRNPF
ncbi:MAG: PIN domain-containing protein [Candidatus Sulfotelmatobacter sp.]